MKARAVFPFTWVPKRIAVAMPTKKGRKKDRKTEKQKNRKTERQKEREKGMPISLTSSFYMFKFLIVHTILVSPFSCASN